MHVKSNFCRMNLEEKVDIKNVNYLTYLSLEEPDDEDLDIPELQNVPTLESILSEKEQGPESDDETTTTLPNTNTLLSPGFTPEGETQSIHSGTKSQTSSKSQKFSQKVIIKA